VALAPPVALARRAAVVPLAVAPARVAAVTVAGVA
jgi:hypothetical protein